MGSTRPSRLLLLSTEHQILQGQAFGQDDMGVNLMKAAQGLPDLPNNWEEKRGQLLWPPLHAFAR